MTSLETPQFISLLLGVFLLGAVSSLIVFWQFAKHVGEKHNKDSDHHNKDLKEKNKKAAEKYSSIKNVVGMQDSSIRIESKDTCACGEDHRPTRILATISLLQTTLRVLSQRLINPNEGDLERLEPGDYDMSVDYIISMRRKKEFDPKSAFKPEPFFYVPTRPHYKVTKCITCSEVSSTLGGYCDTCQPGYRHNIPPDARIMLDARTGEVKSAEKITAEEKKGWHNPK